MNNSFNFISRRKWLRYALNFIYWLLVWIFFDLFFGYGRLFDPYSLSFSFVIVMITAGVAYFFNKFLLPRFLFKGRYGRFLLFALYTLIISLYLELITVLGFFIWIQNFTLLLLDGNSRDIYSLIAGTYFIVLLSVAIKLAEYSFTEQSRRQTALREKIESELKLLKSQIHPHFLFNTLNNIYALAIQKSDQAPDAVLKLSELLDYLIYHGEKEEVELHRELELIENYIELEKLRYGDRLIVHSAIMAEQANVKISPVLLLPFVENAFKHGISKSRGEVWLRIRLELSPEKLIFQIENSRPLQIADDQSGRGIGLDNLNRRLELLYKDRYELLIDDQAESYSVRLILQFN